MRLRGVGAHVLEDEVVGDQHVVVHEDHHVARRGGDAQISGLSGAKAQVGLEAVGEGQPVFEREGDLARVVRGAVVADDHLGEGITALGDQALEQLTYPRAPSVRRDDHGRFH